MYKRQVSGYRGAIVSTDLLSYHIETKRWKNEGFLPVSEDGSPYTATGGCIVSSGDSSLLLAGGVNYSRFSDALDRPLRTKQAASAGNFALRDSLLNETRNYLSQPTEWYKFNSSLLLYNTFTRRWTSLGNYEEPARAGAGIAQHGNTVILIGGELKPGIRTSEVNAFEIFPELYQTAK